MNAAKALEAFKEAIRLKPEQAGLYLAVMYAWLGRYQEALRAVRLEPANARTHLGLGISYGKLGRYDEAVEEFRQAACLEPEDEYVQYNLGFAYSTLGRYPEAVEAYLNHSGANELFKLVSQ